MNRWNLIALVSSERTTIVHLMRAQIKTGRVVHVHKPTYYLVLFSFSIIFIGQLAIKEGTLPDRKERTVYN